MSNEVTAISSDGVDAVVVFEILDEVDFLHDSLLFALRQPSQLDYVPGHLSPGILIDSFIDSLVGAAAQFLGEAFESSLGRFFHGHSFCVFLLVACVHQFINVDSFVGVSLFVHILSFRLHFI